MSDCQFASNSDTHFVYNSDPLRGDGIGLIHVVHRRDPRATRSAPTSDVAARVGGNCAPTWVSPGGGPGRACPLRFLNRPLVLPVSMISPGCVTRSTTPAFP